MFIHRILFSVWISQLPSIAPSLHHQTVLKVFVRWNCGLHTTTSFQRARSEGVVGFAGEFFPNVLEKV